MLQLNHFFSEQYMTCDGWPVIVCILYFGITENIESVDSKNYHDSYQVALCFPFGSQQKQSQPNKNLDQTGAYTGEDILVSFSPYFFLNGPKNVFFVTTLKGYK